ncbi:hypothetical protein GGX14DRAFT_440172 [Mycena pura]|uniref:NAD(P)-binding protein n=1 Tax=Mycena pura TaxID=153505 RepID=A0AAD6VND5_9AGAR|nr:hypothetical protein GGX14DRAFT_440172 [Mycena pura]
MSTAHQHNPTRVRVALVTGAAQGIGRAIALRLAADGLDVGVAGRPAKLAALNGLVEEIEALGRKAHPIATDVSKEAEVQAMVDATVSALGRLDVMVANAGVGSRAASILDADVAEWENIWDVNIRGVIFCYKHAARQMVKQGDGGRIIGASSICGLRGFAGTGGYSISKAAVRSLTQTTALELREHRITVNAYAPGVIETEMSVSNEDDIGHPGSAFKKFFRLPDFRTGQPADVAAVVSFLAAEDTHFVTGQTIGVNDGMCLT